MGTEANDGRNKLYKLAILATASIFFLSISAVLFISIVLYTAPPKASSGLIPNLHNYLIAASFAIAGII